MLIVFCSPLSRASPSQAYPDDSVEWHYSSRACGPGYFQTPGPRRTNSPGCSSTASYERGQAA
ncbi:hypothetical protein BDQ94DRAFT_91472 [Aspergillus welwitschiae]|uniref:Uncharacterized protein n=2 Tax=Aspergillus TaxID=5052 RepID=A0A3F3QEU7_9EURO|nr:hypothetical protein BDQ94DRAFT_91472 [Aspergillus welwitschiae]RDH37615.1 hypothetical protein BDQ94DRAFT_91472 [Aspergillus welwitschiae]RDK39588.1 hypothetical protein M752DRAFT_50688 [Aspergillus phoenicis ATCC 13157]